MTLTFELENSNIDVIKWSMDFKDLPASMDRIGDQEISEYKAKEVIQKLDELPIREDLVERRVQYAKNKTKPQD